jgi:hypothetical protein
MIDFLYLHRRFMVVSQMPLRMFLAMVIRQVTQRPVAHTAIFAEILRFFAAFIELVLMRVAFVRIVLAIIYNQITNISVFHTAPFTIIPLPLTNSHFILLSMGKRLEFCPSSNCTPFCKKRAGAKLRH